MQEAASSQRCPGKCMFRAQAPAQTVIQVEFVVHLPPLTAICSLRWVQGAQQEAELLLAGWDHFWRITFSPEGRMCVDFAPVYLLLKLHLFTYQCLRNPVYGMLFL